MTDTQLHEYGKLILFGIGEVSGKNILIMFEEPGLPLARVLAKIAYEAGARLVRYDFSDNHLKQARLLYGNDDAVVATESWLAEEMKAYSDGTWVRISIKGSDSDYLNESLPKDRAMRYEKAMSAISSELRSKTLTFQIPWILVLMPSREKALQTFPEMTEDAAVKAYEKGIIDVLQLNGDSVTYWKQSFAVLKERKEHFNNLNLTSLRLFDPSGKTDLRMNLIPGYRWATAEEQLPDGNPVRVNIPSCEIYTSPDCATVEGRVEITKPFIPGRIPGGIVRGAWFEFKNGRVVDCGAESGDQQLWDLVNFDDRASFLGEIALVDKDSAVASQDFLFHSTLFDENAASHIAIGAGFPGLVSGMANANREELIAKGINQSMQHQDMMFGSADMCVTGIDKDGNTHELMKDGKFIC